MLVAGLYGCGSAHFAGHTGGYAHPSDAGLYLSIGIGETAAEVIAGGAMIGILMAGQEYAPARPMKSDRLVNEQDCRKPIEQPTANLRCR